MKIQRNCVVCNSLFFAESSRVNAGLGKYCSHRCTGIDQRNSLKDFWSYVDIKGPYDCWLYKGTINKESGYGVFYLNNKGIRAHRLAYELMKGFLDEEMLSCHTCDNPPCCNPNHLFEGTNLDNNRDMIIKGRQKYPCGVEKKISKLTEQQVIEIYNLKGKLSQSKIGEIYDIKQATVFDIHKGNTWKHLQLGS